MKQLGEPSNSGGPKFSPTVLVGPALFGGILLLKSLTQVQPYRQIVPYRNLPIGQFEQYNQKKHKLKLDMDTNMFEQDTTKLESYN